MNHKRFILLAMLLVLTLLVGCGAPAQPANTPAPTEPAAAVTPAQTTDTPPTTEPAAVTSAQEAPAEPAASAEPAALTQADAEAIALEHAGLTADQVSFLHSEYEIDDGVSQYDVEFYHENLEYNYEIHALTGQILEFEKDT